MPAGLAEYGSCACEARALCRDVFQVKILAYFVEAVEDDEEFLEMGGMVECHFIQAAIQQSGNSTKRQFIEWPFHRMHKLIKFSKL